MDGSVGGFAAPGGVDSVYCASPPVRVSMNAPSGHEVKPKPKCGSGSAGRYGVAAFVGVVLGLPSIEAVLARACGEGFPEPVERPDPMRPPLQTADQFPWWLAASAATGRRLTL